MQTRPSTGRRRGLVAALLALAVSLALVPAAGAARTPTYQVGDRVTFSVHSNAAKAQQYGMYITVAARRRLDRHGGLKRTDVGTFARMTRKRGNVYKWTTPAYTFDTWFMQRPGTYYWQTQYTDCDVAGCTVFSRVKTFKVA